MDTASVDSFWTEGRSVSSWSSGRVRDPALPHLDLDALQVVLTRLDHSPQKGKGLVGRSGALRQRRPPSRSSCRSSAESITHLQDTHHLAQDPTHTPRVVNIQVQFEDDLKAQLQKLSEKSSELHQEQSRSLHSKSNVEYTADFSQHQSNSLHTKPNEKFQSELLREQNRNLYSKSNVEYTSETSQLQSKNIHSKANLYQEQKTPDEGATLLQQQQQPSCRFTSSHTKKDTRRKLLEQRCRRSAGLTGVSNPILNTCTSEAEETFRRIKEEVSRLAAKRKSFSDISDSCNSSDTSWWDTRKELRRQEDLRGWREEKESLLDSASVTLERNADENRSSSEADVVISDRESIADSGLVNRRTVITINQKKSKSATSLVSEDSTPLWVRDLQTRRSLRGEEAKSRLVPANVDPDFQGGINVSIVSQADQRKESTSRMYVRQSDAENRPSRASAFNVRQTIEKRQIQQERRERRALREKIREQLRSLSEGRVRKDSSSSHVSSFNSQNSIRSKSMSSLDQDQDDYRSESPLFKVQSSPTLEKEKEEVRSYLFGVTNLAESEDSISISPPPRHYYHHSKKSLSPHQQPAQDPNNTSDSDHPKSWKLTQSLDALKTHQLIQDSRSGKVSKSVDSVHESDQGSIYSSVPSSLVSVPQWQDQKFGQIEHSPRLLSPSLLSSSGLSKSVDVCSTTQVLSSTPKTKQDKLYDKSEEPTETPVPPPRRHRLSLSAGQITLEEDEKPSWIRVAKERRSLRTARQVDQLSDRASTANTEPEWVSRARKKLENLNVTLTSTTDFSCGSSIVTESSSAWSRGGLDALDDLRQETSRIGEELAEEATARLNAELGLPNTNRMLEHPSSSRDPSLERPRVSFDATATEASDGDSSRRLPVRTRKSHKEEVRFGDLKHDWGGAQTKATKIANGKQKEMRFGEVQVKETPAEPCERGRETRFGDPGVSSAPQKVQTTAAEMGEKRTVMRFGDSPMDLFSNGGPRGGNTSSSKFESVAGPDPTKMTAEQLNQNVEEYDFPIPTGNEDASELMKFLEDSLKKVEVVPEVVWSEDNRPKPKSILKRRSVENVLHELKREEQGKWLQKVEHRKSASFDWDRVGKGGDTGLDITHTKTLGHSHTRLQSTDSVHQPKADQHHTTPTSTSTNISTSTFTATNASFFNVKLRHVSPNSRQPASTNDSLRFHSEHSLHRRSQGVYMNGERHSGDYTSLTVLPSSSERRDMPRSASQSGGSQGSSPASSLESLSSDSGGGSSSPYTVTHNSSQQEEREWATVNTTAHSTQKEEKGWVGRRIRSQKSHSKKEEGQTMRQEESQDTQGSKAGRLQRLQDSTPPAWATCRAGRAFTTSELKGESLPATLANNEREDPSPHNSVTPSPDTSQPSPTTETANCGDSSSISYHHSSAADLLDSPPSSLSSHSSTADVGDSPPSSLPHLSSTTYHRDNNTSVTSVVHQPNLEELVSNDMTDMQNSPSLLSLHQTVETLEICANSSQEGIDDCVEIRDAIETPDKNVGIETFANKDGSEVQIDSKAGERLIAPPSTHTTIMTTTLAACPASHPPNITTPIAEAEEEKLPSHVPGRAPSPSPPPAPAPPSDPGGRSPAPAPEASRIPYYPEDGPPSPTRAPAKVFSFTFHPDQNTRPQTTFRDLDGDSLIPIRHQEQQAENIRRTEENTRRTEETTRRSEENIRRIEASKIFTTFTSPSVVRASEAENTRMDGTKSFTTFTHLNDAQTSEASERRTDGAKIFTIITNPNDVRTSESTRTTTSGNPQKEADTIRVGAKIFTITTNLNDVRTGDSTRTTINGNLSTPTASSPDHTIRIRSLRSCFQDQDQIEAEATPTKPARTKLGQTSGERRMVDGRMSGDDMGSLERRMAADLENSERRKAEELGSVERRKVGERRKYEDRGSGERRKVDDRGSGERRKLEDRGSGEGRKTMDDITDGLQFSRIHQVRVEVVDEDEERRESQRRKEERRRGSLLEWEALQRQRLEEEEKNRINKNLSMKPVSAKIKELVKMHGSFMSSMFSRDKKMDINGTVDGKDDIVFKKISPESYQPQLKEDVSKEVPAAMRSPYMVKKVVSPSTAHSSHQGTQRVSRRDYPRHRSSSRKASPSPHRLSSRKASPSPHRSSSRKASPSPRRSPTRKASPSPRRSYSKPRQSEDRKDQTSHRILTESNWKHSTANKESSEKFNLKLRSSVSPARRKRSNVSSASPDRRSRSKETISYPKSSAIISQLPKVSKSKRDAGSASADSVNKASPSAPPKPISIHDNSVVSSPYQRPSRDRSRDREKNKNKYSSPETFSHEKRGSPSRASIKDPKNRKDWLNKMLTTITTEQPSTSSLESKSSHSPSRSEQKRGSVLQPDIVMTSLASASVTPVPPTRKSSLWTTPEPSTSSGRKNSSPALPQSPKNDSLISEPSTSSERKYSSPFLPQSPKHISSTLTVNLAKPSSSPCDTKQPSPEHIDVSRFSKLASTTSSESPNLVREELTLDLSPLTIRRGPVSLSSILGDSSRSSSLSSTPLASPRATPERIIKRDSLDITPKLDVIIESSIREDRKGKFLTTEQKENIAPASNVKKYIESYKDSADHMESPSSSLESPFRSSRFRDKSEEKRKGIKNEDDVNILEKPWQPSQYKPFTFGKPSVTLKAMTSGFEKQKANNDDKMTTEKSSPTLITSGKKFTTNAQDIGSNFSSRLSSERKSLRTRLSEARDAAERSPVRNEGRMFSQDSFTSRYSNERSTAMSRETSGRSTPERDSGPVSLSSILLKEPEKRSSIAEEPSNFNFKPELSFSEELNDITDKYCSDLSTKHSPSAKKSESSPYRKKSSIKSNNSDGVFTEPPVRKGSIRTKKSNTEPKSKEASPARDNRRPSETRLKKDKPAGQRSKEASPSPVPPKSPTKTGSTPAQSKTSVQRNSSLKRNRQEELRNSMRVKKERRTSEDDPGAVKDETMVQDPGGGWTRTKTTVRRARLGSGDKAHQIVRTNSGKTRKEKNFKANASQALENWAAGTSVQGKLVKKEGQRFSHETEEEVVGGQRTSKSVVRRVVRRGSRRLSGGGELLTETKETASTGAAKDDKSDSKEDGEKGDSSGAVVVSGEDAGVSRRMKTSTDGERYMTHSVSDHAGATKYTTQGVNNKTTTSVEVIGGDDFAGRRAVEGKTGHRVVVERTQDPTGRPSTVIKKVTSQSRVIITKTKRKTPVVV